MNLDDLRIVTAVAKNGSMNRAAAELHMVQSNVTARVRQLEEDLGVSLFVRHSRGVTLSDAGERLLSYSGRIDALVNEAMAAVKETGVPRGELRIGSLEQTLSLRLTPVLQEYATRYPAVALTVTTGNTPDLIEQVLDGTVEGAFVLGPVNQAGLNEEAIFCESLTLVTGLATPTMADLQQTTGVKALVRGEACSYRKLLTGILERRGVQHQVLAIASSEGMRSLVQANVGLMLVPKAMLAKSWGDAAVAVHELTGPEAQVEMVFITRKDRSNSSAMDAFLKLSRDASNIGS